MSIRSNTNGSIPHPSVNQYKILDTFGEAIGTRNNKTKQKKQQLRNHLHTLRSYKKIPLVVDCSLWDQKQQHKN